MFGINESAHGADGRSCFCMGCCATRNAELAQQASARGDVMEAAMRGSLGDQQLMRARDEREGRR